MGPFQFTLPTPLTISSVSPTILVSPPRTPTLIYVRTITIRVATILVTTNIPIYTASTLRPISTGCPLVSPKPITAVGLMARILSSRLLLSFLQSPRIATGMG